MKNRVTLLALIISCIGCSQVDEKAATTASSTGTVTEMNPTLVVAVGKVEPEKNIVSIAAPSGGIVESVYRKDGDSITKGELLVQLDNDLELERVKEIRTQLQSQRTKIEIEETQLKETGINLANKKLLLEKTRRLVQNGAETQQVLDDLIKETQVLEVTLERNNASIRYERNRLNELSAQLETAETELQRKQFTAPFTGILLDITVNPGESISQYSSYAEAAPAGKLMVKAEVDELFSGKVKPGQKADICFTGSETVVARGEVVQVSPYLKKKSLFSEKANDQEDRRVREIRILLTEPGNLIINSKIECKIKL